ncbi:DUF3221 domain-containing protein [Domibacillus sp. DTU_2020_1001157_1_SI_ALB_TIR_016]|uniref:DUF3221 domain-containing protein n=1 Tax=Domibacillus sp. DTU_2020_1001157_1_SI_ALB_TIR_016 TaxID=3077789 RepID=UPI0028E32FAE|nr:DUF3221 domain-containing protein [Domibacillus sp. DTU_2020_1001157_1_SI_ALB_TIR_016]WNS78492.1 DUF3221 domain-containing protein [Domibacillus sp. DTU_2020_1001157_1_SI_ALB_TIR_016]
MRQRLVCLFISLMALFVIGCSNKAPEEFDLDQLTRVDIRETIPQSKTDFAIITEEKDLDIIRKAFREVQWEPGAMAEIQPDRKLEATFFYTYEKNMPERLFEYEVYLKDGIISLQSKEEGYGKLSKAQSEKLKKLLFKNEDTEAPESYVAEGYIVKKTEDEIRVITEIKKEEIMGNEEQIDSLIKEKYDGKGYVFNLNKIHERTKSSLNVGQKVVVEYDEANLSAPSNANALKVRTVQE